MIDVQVNRLLYVAHMIERAIHEPDGWTIRWGLYDVPATRVLTDSGVRFDAVFPEVCLIAPMPRNAALCHRGEVMALRALDHPGDCAFAVQWAMDLAPAKAAAL